MEFQIEFLPQDIQNIRDIISKYQSRVFVKARIERNVSDQILSPSHEEVWRTMVMCLLTTQQRSNPASPISRFLLEQPFRLSLQKLETVGDVQTHVQNEIKNFGGIRFGPRISEQVKYNLEILRADGWDKIGKYLLKLLEQRKQKPQIEHHQLEREAARFINYTFKGFGPKQSRNFWQALGLTRYEFVLDSRVTKWLREINFPIPLTPMSLGEEEFYCFLSDILRDFCNQADVLPCVLDAAIFSSFDREEWAEDSAVW